MRWLRVLTRSFVGAGGGFRSDHIGPGSQKGFSLEAVTKMPASMGWLEKPGLRTQTRWNATQPAPEPGRD